MSKRLRLVPRFVSLGLLTMWSSLALAQESFGIEFSGGEPSRWSVLGWGILESLIYTVLGIILLAIGYKVFGWVVPFDLNKELSEDDNPAVGIFMAGIFVAIGLVIAAAIGGK